jgi:hypothetical protein
MRSWPKVTNSQSLPPPGRYDANWTRRRQGAQSHCGHASMKLERGRFAYGQFVALPVAEVAGVDHDGPTGAPRQTSRSPAPSPSAIADSQHTEHRSRRQRRSRRRTDLGVAS